MQMAVEKPSKRMIMRVNEKLVCPAGNWTDSSIFSDEWRIKESQSHSQSLLPLNLPDLSRKVEGDSACRVLELTLLHKLNLFYNLSRFHHPTEWYIFCMSFGIVT